MRICEQTLPRTGGIAGATVAGGEPEPQPEPGDPGEKQPGKPGGDAPKQPDDAEEEEQLAARGRALH